MQRALLPVIALVLGIALGFASWGADHVSSDSSTTGLAIDILRRAGNAPTPWLIVAFVIGALSRSVVGGAISATLSLAVAVVVYYVLIHLSGERVGVDLVRIARAWLAVAALAGPLLGGAGGAWSGGTRVPRITGAIVLGSSLAGIGLFYLLDNIEYWPNSDREVALGAAHFVLGLAAGALVVTGFRVRATVIVASALFSIAASAITRLILEVMREVFNA